MPGNTRPQRIRHQPRRECWRRVARRRLGSALVAMLVLATIALGSATCAAADPPTETTPKAAPPLRLLMVLWRGETPAEQGFLAELQRQHVALSIDQINADQKREQLARQFWAMGNSLLDYDAVYSFGTTASVMTHSLLRGRVPQLYSMVSDPREAGLVTAAGGQPVTGTTDAIAAELKIRTAQQLFPIGHIGFLFNARERNARVQLEEMEQLCARLGIKLTILRVAPESSSLAQQLQWLQRPNTIDTLYLPSDSYLISQSPVIMAALANTPYRVLGATDSFVRDGALLAIAPDYPALGRQLAQRLIDLSGAPATPALLAPIGVRQSQILYNERTRQRLGIEFPAALEQQMTPIR